MYPRQKVLGILALLAAVAVHAPLLRVRADEFSAAEHKRQTIYHSPQQPGFTS